MPVLGGLERCATWHIIYEKAPKFPLDPDKGGIT
jgi:hypothetical protein